MELVNTDSSTSQTECEMASFVTRVVVCVVVAVEIAVLVDVVLGWRAGWGVNVEKVGNPSPCACAPTQTGSAGGPLGVN